MKTPTLIFLLGMCAQGQGQSKPIAIQTGNYSPVTVTGSTIEGYAQPSKPVAKQVTPPSDLHIIYGEHFLEEPQLTISVSAHGDDHKIYTLDAGKGWTCRPTTDDQNNPVVAVIVCLKSAPAPQPSSTQGGK